MNTDSWSPLGRIAPTELVEARLSLHYAAQPLAAAAYALLPMQEDHHHTNLLWSRARSALVGRPLPRAGRAFLEPAALRIGVLAPSGEAASLELGGLRLGEAFDAFAELLRERGEAVPEAGLELPDYDLPEARVASSEPFSPREAQAGALEELARWFQNAEQALQPVATQALDGAELRGWPHHFDLAALLALEGDRFVGAGFSPGDGSYAEPYFYVSPWPKPPEDRLPALPEGAHWHTEGFTSAVLPATRLVQQASPAEQERTVSTFLESAVARSLELVDGGA